MVAFMILSLGIVLQIRRIYLVKNAKSIAIWEVVLRFVASSLLLVKFFGTYDLYLIIGQGIFTAIYLYYFVLVARYKYFKIGSGSNFNPPD
jgi:hypothetical protein